MIPLCVALFSPVSLSIHSTMCDTIISKVHLTAILPFKNLYWTELFYLY
ncbi:hypothetical protein PUN28_009328 [Cardiocondyla obscurior]|uniref:NADH dehydrogenase subunit 4 n=1 Tax=Cardiocondyla obscurior TaxID=286306 RepID=A0AAW2FWJ5_9HYME